MAELLKQPDPPDDDNDTGRKADPTELLTAPTTRSYPMSTDLIEAPDGEIIEAAKHSPLTVPPNHVDPAQARVESVARTLDAAYQRASTLELTDAEAKALMAPFPDDCIRAGAGGDEKLLYIEHAYLRQRLLEVFGPGRWALIQRKLWSEEFKTYKGAVGVRVYSDCVLLIRGCYVGEAIADMSYYPGNDKSNYGDAVEGAKSAALRRCLKDLGVGLQVFEKSYCEAWKARKSGKAAPVQFSPLHDEFATRFRSAKDRGDLLERVKLLTDAEKAKLTDAEKDSLKKIHGICWAALPPAQDTPPAKPDDDIPF